MTSLLALLDFLMPWLFLFILSAGVFFTFIGQGIQFRSLAKMVSLLLKKQSTSSSQHAIDARKALFTAMSTTIGIGNIVGPIVAIGFGGPGALLCYIFASLFGAATTFTEVSLAVQYRQKNKDGSISGGPMPYLKKSLGAFWALIYAIFGATLLAAWTTTQSNSIASLLTPYGIAPLYTALFLTASITCIIWGGIRWIAEFNAKLVPFMFSLYCGATCFIIFSHLENLPKTLELILSSFWQPQAIASGVAVPTFLEMLRWGLARAVQSNEAGVGTATIPHSMTNSQSSLHQGILAMVSVYSNGVICLLSGLTVLISGAWEKGEVSSNFVFDISLLAHLFTSHIPQVGGSILVVCALLFAFGTILGSFYNGSQCFAFATKHRFLWLYQALTGAAIVFGCLFDLKFIWSFVDYFIYPVAIPHICALLFLGWRQRKTMFEI